MNFLDKFSWVHSEIDKYCFNFFSQGFKSPYEGSYFDTEYHEKGETVFIWESEDVTKYTVSICVPCAEKRKIRIYFERSTQELMILLHDDGSIYGITEFEERNLDYEFVARVLFWIEGFDALGILSKHQIMELSLERADCLRKMQL